MLNEVGRSVGHRLVGCGLVDRVIDRLVALRGRVLKVRSAQTHRDFAEITRIILI